MLKEPCNSDYFPCTCYISKEPDTYNKTHVTCDNVPVEDVQDIFRRTNDSEIYSLEFIVPSYELVTIPEDLLGNTSAEVIWMHQNYYYDGPYTHMVIDHLAFRSSQDYTTEFSLKYWDLHLQADLDFLMGFNKLRALDFYEISNLMALEYMPQLPSLESLSIIRCQNLSETGFPELSGTRLKVLHLDQNYAGDSVINNILTSLVGSTSADSLESFWSNSEDLTMVPNQLPFFPQLYDVTLGTNSISHIPSSSFSFSSPVTYISLIRNGIRTIEPGAFEGTV